MSFFSGSCRRWKRCGWAIRATRRLTLGPWRRPDLVGHLDAQVRATIAAGARLLTGGAPLAGPGCYYPPTVLTDIPMDSPAYQEELFGPVASVFFVDGIDEAIRLANDTVYGLGASVWTTDAERSRIDS